MLIKMTRSQRTAAGFLQRGVAYDIDAARHKELLDNLLAKKFAEKTTKKKLVAQAEKLANLQQAKQADEQAKESNGIRPVLGYADDAAAAKVRIKPLADAARDAKKLAETADATANNNEATDADKAAAVEAAANEVTAVIAHEKAINLAGAYSDLITAIAESFDATGADGAAESTAK